MQPDSLPGGKVAEAVARAVNWLAYLETTGAESTSLLRRTVQGYERAGGRQ